jgi:formylglycine-generating enzyme required for sulfatase activity
MHGNIWEWCWDWYEPYTAQLATNPRDPKKPAADGEWRVVRGGSFVNSPENLRSASRDVVLPVDRGGLGGLPDLRVRFSGFRCVRVLPQRLE